MPRIYDYFFPAMWLSFMDYWRVMSENVKVSERRESLLSRLVRLVLMVLAIALLCLPRVPIPLLNERFLAQGAWTFWSGADNIDTP